MGQSGDSVEALDAARRRLAARDADLAAADRALVDVVAGAHAVAAESIGRIDTIAAEVEAAIGQPGDGPAGAREVARHLVAKNREIAEVVRDARAALEAKTVALRELTDRYTQR